VKFSIVTPSFNQHDWLRLCVASVADQQGAEFEHIVQDGGDERAREALAGWTGAFPRLKVFVEKDAGMYDAINRGLRRATGDICAYLNCDEQYLPGALNEVRGIFEQRPEIDLVFGDALVVDRRGHYVCHRQHLAPSLRHTVACQLGILSCVIFFRRRLVERGILFDDSFRTAGDVDFVVRCLEAQVRMIHVPRLLAAFTETGDNLGLTPTVAQEMRRIQSRYPAWWSRCGLIWVTFHRLRRWRAGYYAPKPTTYALYALQHPDRRREFRVDSPTFLWRNRL
jgi:glycosyltransferase involved in cell wall biosynthesis